MVTIKQRESYARGLLSLFVYQFYIVTRPIVLGEDKELMKFGSFLHNIYPINSFCIPYLGAIK